MYLFFKSYNTSRGGLGASIDVMDFDMFKKDFKKGKEYSEAYRYAKIGGATNHFRYMSLKEFEEIFKEDMFFTPEQVDDMFKKEIAVKYGKKYKEQAKKQKLPAIKKKDLIIGGVYKNENGNHKLYLGKCRRTTEWFAEVGYRWNYDKSVISRIEIDDGYYCNDTWGEYYVWVDGRLNKSVSKLVEYTGKKIDVENGIFVKEYSSKRITLTLTDYLKNQKAQLEETE